MTTPWIVKPFPHISESDWWSLFRTANNRTEYLRGEKPPFSIRRFKHHSDALAYAAKLNRAAILGEKGKP